MSQHASMETAQKCPTIVIEDSPSDKDLLAHGSEIGPHNRVARAVAEVILSNCESGGKMIGLEGGWGSGKSTVINLIKEQLSSNSKGISFFYFDAWAHEGDPLRRTYLESLIRHFQSIKWVDKSKWDSRLDSLAKRRRITQTRTVPTTTTLGKVFAISALLVPVGVPFLRTALSDGITVDGEHSISWIFWIGVLLSCAPFLVILWNSLRRKRLDGFSKWAFIAGNAITETRQDTTETPEPTSIEFEDTFRELMNEALPDSEKRQGIIVLDNLDRVDSKFTLSIWSTLQTFLQDRSTKNESWYRKLWILIPYDPIGLRQVWKSQTNDNKNSNRTNEVADSFIDKSFQLRFEVPPLVLSNWKTFLIDLLKQALPAHAKEDECLNQIYRIYNIGRKEVGQSPTPRELKLFVNQIGSIHRQWEDTFPLSHIAYYVMLRRQRTEVAKELLRGNTPDPRIEAFLEPELKANLAGLIFNVSAKSGQQLLLRDPIISALSNIHEKELVDLKENHGEGFWAVLEEIASTGLNDSDISFLASASTCLFKSELYILEGRHEVRAVMNGLREAILKLDKWTFSKNIGKGLSLLIQLISGQDFTIRVVSRVKSTLDEMEIKEPPQATEIVEGLFDIINSINKLNHEDSIGEPFVIPVDSAGWIQLSSVLISRDPEYLSLLKPRDDHNSLSELLATIVSKGEFLNTHISSIVVSQKSFGDSTDWSKLGEAIEKRLNAHIAVAPHEVEALIKCLYQLKNFNWSTATDILGRLVQGGYPSGKVHISRLILAP